MKTSQLLSAFNLTAAACMLPVLVLVGMESLAQPAKPDAGRVLDRLELQALENIARRAESMMEVSNVVPTRVWAHAVTDARGRQGIFISSMRPLFDEKDEHLIQVKRAWVVFGLIAAVKYAEGSPLGHIAFTDADGLQGERCYYDLDIAPAREIQRDLIRGRLALDDAYDVIAARWEKVTSSHDLAIR
jgi:hypothetical protein